MTLKRIQEAINLSKVGKFDEAFEIFDSLLREEPNNQMILSAVGLMYISKKDYQSALIYMERAYQSNKTYATTSALGLVYYELCEYGKAADIFIETLEFEKTPMIYNKLTTCLFNLRLYANAIEYANKGYELFPNDKLMIANKVKALTQSGKMLEAEELCLESLKTYSDSPALWMHLGFLKELIYSEEEVAIECYKAALKNGSSDAYYNMAVSYHKIGDYENSEKCYLEFLKFNPNNEAGKACLGMLYLAQKKFKEGARLFCKRYLETKVFGENIWQPDTPLSKKINVFCDQGRGDNIQFVRYLPFLKEKGIEFKLYCYPELKGIFENSYPNAEISDKEDADKSLQCLRLTDIAYALDMDFDNIPFAEGYLKSETADIKSDKLKVGLCWEAGSTAIRTMINRTINIDTLKPIFDLENIQYYCLQKEDTFGGCEKFPQIINLGKDFKNFEDTAKAIMAMDLVITVDTSVAHLAGALGKKTFMLLPYATDWRWFEDTKTTPWYSSMELFKQVDRIGWEKEIGDIICKLKEYSL